MTLTVPDALDIVAWAPVVTLLIVIRLPAAPLRLKLLNVFVVPDVKKTEAGCVVFVMLLNVLLPVIVREPAPP